MYHLLARAKLNLFLNITGKNVNSYHLLNSLVCFASLHDVLILEVRSNFSHNFLEYKGKYAHLLPKYQDNLIFQLIDYMLSQYDIRDKFFIKLEKNIPVGGGLGGGSSNIAVLLIFLNEHYNLGLSLSALMDIGLKFGADVPSCLLQKCNFMYGIGEKILPLNLQTPLYAIIVNNGHFSSTKEVFSNYFCKESSLNENLKQYFMLNYLNKANLFSLLKRYSNDLTQTILRLHPPIREVIEVLNSLKGCYGRVSGTGSSCFLLYDNYMLALSDYKYLKISKIKWESFLCILR